MKPIIAKPIPRRARALGRSLAQTVILTEHQQIERWPGPPTGEWVATGVGRKRPRHPPWPLLLLVRDKIMRVIAAVVAVICCGALVACFHHRQAVVEYAPPLSTSPYK